MYIRKLNLNLKIINNLMRVKREFKNKKKFKLIIIFNNQRNTFTNENIFKLYKYKYFQPLTIKIKKKNKCFKYLKTNYYFFNNNIFYKNANFLNKK